MSNPVKYYLAVYNLIAFTFWALYITDFMVSGTYLTQTGLHLLIIAQGLAVLEILHTALKWVKSPVGSTAAQVASRLLVVAFVYLYNDHNTTVAVGNMPAYGQIGLTIISLAWSVTELVRYSFYFLGLINRQPYWLLWMRYSFFVMLYPAGVIGEWLILTSPLSFYGLNFKAYDVLVAVLIPAYLIGFPVLYRYMWRQRKAKLV